MNKDDMYLGVIIFAIMLSMVGLFFMNYQKSEQVNVLSDQVFMLVGELEYCNARHSLLCDKPFEKDGFWYCNIGDVVEP